MSNFTRIVKIQLKLWKFHLQDVILWNLTFVFLGSFLSCYYRKLITSIAIEKCKKKNAILFKLSWFKALVHWKLKFLPNSVLKCLFGFVIFCPQSFLQRKFSGAKSSRKLLLIIDPAMPLLIPTSVAPDLRKRIVLIFRALTWFVVTEIEICTDSSFCSVDGTLGGGITGTGTLSFFSKPKKRKRK